MSKVKENITRSQLNIHNLIDEIRFETPRIGTPDEIKQKEKQLEKMKESVRVIKEELKELNIAMNREPDYFKKLEIFNEMKEIKRKHLPNLDNQKNELNKLKGKDFYYSIDTGFQTHKILRSKLLRHRDNKIFLNLMRKDVERAIKNLKASDYPDKERKIKILRNKLMPVINFNLEVDKIRNEEVDNLDVKTKRRILKASSEDMGKDEKQGEYPIDIIMADEVIKLL